MKRWLSILAFLSLGVLAASAQVERSGDVQLLEFDGKTALFAVQGMADKKADVLRSAEETIFDTLFYTGVDGINEGRPLMNKRREQLLTKDYAVNFFKKRMHAYLKTDSSGKAVLAELLGSSISTGAGYSGVYLIPIKYNVLVRDLKTEGLLNQ